MKAIVSTQYGPPELLQLQDVEQPQPKANEVLVRIRATAVNDYDWAMVTGIPRVYRLLFGLSRPRKPIPGMELSGVVEGVGPGVSKFKVGDAVFGDTSDHGFGTFAQYICIHENALTLKPEKMSFEEAASIPHASLLAYQGLFDIGGLQPNQKILINGAGGGVGTFALQMAKLSNCEVTGVDTGEKLNMMKYIGFDHVIDYKQEDFTKNGQKYDLVLDAKTNRSVLSYVRSLKPGGIYVTVGGFLLKLLQLLLFGRLVGTLTGRRFKILGLKANRQIEKVIDLFNAGKLKCQIDGPHSMEQAPLQIQRFGDGVHAGKIIVKVD